ncbi:hypothetical protein [Winogradskyella sp.]|uniref:hypothetical protein n=1 Tax=Winogradskyella sp. TaxID=1883156 RepID=UPI002602CE6D|nr:hypothetical protein [Winogradskyella sp.]
MSVRKKLKRDIITIIAILLIPVIAYMYLLFPNTKDISIFNYSLSSGYYEDFQYFIWVLSQKFMFISVFIIWYITTKNWWKNILLIPLLVFVFQFIMVINNNVNYFDEYEGIAAMIIAIPIILAFYFLIKRLRNILITKEINDDIELEVEDLLYDLSNKNFDNYKHLKTKLDSIRSIKPMLDKEIYLKELILLKDQLTS